MKRGFLAIIFCFVLLLSAYTVKAQCSICTRTASQLGHKPAQALNAGILYLAAAPLLLAGFIGYRWWRNNSGQ